MLRVVEGIEGTWHYHMSVKKNGTESLCGRRTMHCYLPLHAWGTKTHLNERYCEECRKLSCLIGSSEKSDKK